jgi:hypothetical protein
MATSVITAPLRALSGGRIFAKNGFRSNTDDGKPLFIVPAFVMQQGMGALGFE